MVDSRPSSLSARNRLLRAAATVWGADPSASLDSVARAAGVGRATLHRYFTSRTELMQSAALDGIAALADALEHAGCFRLDAAPALQAMVDVLVPFGDRLHFLLVCGDLMGDPAVAAAEAEVDARLHRVLDIAVADGLLRADVPRAWRFRAIEALIYSAWTAVAAGELARLDAPALVHSTLLRGLGPPSLAVRGTR